jgi:hypothetical protein
MLAPANPPTKPKWFVANFLIYNVSVQLANKRGLKKIQM